MTKHQLRKALATVAVWWTGSAWAVKRVTDARIRRFKTKERALEWAKDLAAKWRCQVVVRGDGWEEIR